MTATVYDIPIDAMHRVLVRSGHSPDARTLYGVAVLVMLDHQKPLPCDDRRAAKMVRMDLRMYRRVVLELLRDGSLVRMSSGEITAPILDDCRPSRNVLPRIPRASIPDGTREAVLAKTAGRCAYCAVTLVVDDAGSPHAYQPDHVLPVVLGGPDDVANLIPSCRSCNSKKRAKTALVFFGGDNDASGS